MNLPTIDLDPVVEAMTETTAVIQELTDTLIELAPKLRKIERHLRPHYTARMRRARRRGIIQRERRARRREARATA